MDDAADKQISKGFVGVDRATDGTRLPPDQLRQGLNVWCNGDGYAKSRPGAALNTNTGETNYGNMVYYDQPGFEYTVLFTDLNVRRVSSTATGSSSTVVAAVATLAFGNPVQLLDRIFWLRSGVINYINPATGVTGTVTQFSDGTAMPNWSRLVVQNFRVLAFTDQAEKLYTSAIGQAHNSADWIKTDNIRVGDGDGDPARALMKGQAGFVIMLCGRTAWQIDIRAAAVADWTSLRVTALAGCAATRTAIAVGQDVVFLSRYGVVSLGALAATDSISPSATISAPIQPYIDSINWSAIETAWVTKWRDLLLFALPLNSDTYPIRIFPYNVRTKQWQPIWYWGAHLVAGCVTGFGDKEETLIQGGSGPVLRLDEAIAYDELSSGVQTAFSSWLVTRAFDHGVPQQYKQPFYLELIFGDGHAGVNTIVGLLPEGTTLGDYITGSVGEMTVQGYQVGTTFTGNGSVQKKRWLVRSASRYMETMVVVWTTSGKFNLREVALSSFIDPPFYS